ncbi:MAG: helix-turn-helix domain-containing protein [Bacillota bacterium]|nr:helix-turn-helix domain-containing protein [Bacillota bacterium]
MRREYITYPSDMPISITFCTVTNYPLHWHNSIEIIYVLKGRAFVTIGSDKYELIENDLEIINIDEDHMIFSEDKDNKILIFHIEPYFFEKYYSDIENMFFFTNTSEDNAQKGEAYEELRVFLSEIVCEAVQKHDDYDEEIEDILVKLLYHLINNFHYLIYENESLKQKEEQLERYHRISKYIYNNYNDNITLNDIAKKEFLSTDYLSHVIKDITGHSFTDIMNLTRIEEAQKLLLDTDKTISEISYEVGFSHTRYLDKHFKSYYKYTPFQYRKKFKITEKQYETQKISKTYELNESLELLTYYLEDYDRFNYEDRITKININMKDDLGEFKKEFKNVIDVGDAFELLIESNKDSLELIQDEIGFEYARILNVFSQDMCVFSGSKFFNWNRNREVFEFLETINIKPLIVLEDTSFKSENLFDAVKSFLEYFSELEILEYKNFKFQFHKSINKTVKEEITKLICNEYELEISEDDFYMEDSINNIYDTAYMLPYIINNVIENRNFNKYLTAFDVLDKQVNLTNEVFFGYPGLVNDKGIKKPSYYAYYLLNKLGDILVSKGDGYIATRSENEYQILLYSHHDNIDKLISFESFSKLRGYNNVTAAKFSINVVNIPSAITIINYAINEKAGSSYNYWVDMGSPKRLSKEESQILHDASFPSISFKNLKKSTVYNIRTELKGYGALLIIIS